MRLDSLVPVHCGEYGFSVCYLVILVAFFSQSIQDIIPPYGLCFHKPSVLWPPPAVNITTEVRSDVRESFQTATRDTTLVNKVVSQWLDKTIVGGYDSVSVDGTEKHVELL